MRRIQLQVLLGRHPPAPGCKYRNNVMLGELGRLVSAAGLQHAVNSQPSSFLEDHLGQGLLFPDQHSRLRRGGLPLDELDLGLAVGQGENLEIPQLGELE